MKLYRQYGGSVLNKFTELGKEATLEDLRTALAEYGRIDFPLEPTELLLAPIEDCLDDAYCEKDTDPLTTYKELITAAQGDKP